MSSFEYQVDLGLVFRIGLESGLVSTLNFT